MTDMQTPEDPLAKVIEKSIEKHTHMARRLYPDVYASHVAADVREWLAAEVAEEQEWEYSIAYPRDGEWDPDGVETFESESDALEDLAKGDYLSSDRVVRRGKAGPWEPVEPAREAGR